MQALSTAEFLTTSTESVLCVRIKVEGTFTHLHWYIIYLPVTYQHVSF